MSTVYVTTFNHASLAGIAEIAELLRGELERAGFRALYSENLPSDIVRGDFLLVADEFSEPLIVDAMRRFKEAHPEVMCICLLTEFFSAGNRFRPPSLNNFKEPVQSLLFDNFLYVYSHVAEQFALFGDLKFRSPSFLNYAMAIIALPWLACLKLRRWRTPLRRLVPFHERAYYWFRMLGLMSVSDVFDFFLVVHPGIHSEALIEALHIQRERIDFLMLPPPMIERQNLLNRRLKFGIDVSGSVNSYRMREVRKLRRLLSKLSPGRRFARCSLRKFDDSKMEYFLSFNPPQSRSWRYSSPMRIIGAIARGQIPLMARKFDDHPAEELAVILPADPGEAKAFLGSLILSSVVEPDLYVNSAWEKLSEYRQLAERHNYQVLQLILKAQS